MPSLSLDLQGWHPPMLRTSSLREPAEPLTLYRRSVGSVSSDIASADDYPVRQSAGWSHVMHLLGFLVLLILRIVVPTRVRDLYVTNE
jgi:hypothetical protein